MEYETTQEVQETMNNNNIVITNKKIIDYYARNPMLDVEAVNLIFIDLFEKLFVDMNATMNTAVTTSINSQILTEVSKLNMDMNSLSTNIRTFNNNLINAIQLKFQESKKEYLEDIKNTLSIQFSQNTEKVSQLLQKSNEQLMDKTALLFNDIPKSNNAVFSQIRESISQFQQTIVEDTNKLAMAINATNSENNNNKDDAYNNFINQFETKSLNMMQPILSVMNASEDRISSNINNLLLNATTQEKVFGELSEFLGKYKNSSYKGQFGENKLESVLTGMFPSAEVINTTGIKESCDFRVNRSNIGVSNISNTITTNDKVSFLIETKNYDRNVNMDEVKKFIRDVEIQKTHGIFLSQHSGITSKQNFHIDIIDSQIMVYVHNVDYSPQLIQIAVDIIDSLSSKLSIILNEPEEGIKIDKNVLDSINTEYSLFIKRKTTMITLLKDFQKKMQTEIEDIKLPALSSFMNTHYGTLNQDINNQALMCNLCNNFLAKSNKSLSSHQRYCKKNMEQLNVNNTSSTSTENELLAEFTEI